MAIPIIRADGSIHGAGTAGIDSDIFSLGETITFVDTQGANNLAVHAWVILERPTGAVSSLTTPTAVSSTLLLDAYGTWIVQDTVGGLATTRRIAVVLPKIKARIPGTTEENEWNASGNTEGWGEAMERMLRNIDNLHYVKTNIVTVGNRSHNFATPLVITQFEFNPYTYNTNVMYLAMNLRSVVANGSVGITTHVVLFNVTDNQIVANMAYTSDQMTSQSVALVIGNASGNVKLASKIYEIRIWVDAPVSLADAIHMGGVELELRTLIP